MFTRCGLSGLRGVDYVLQNYTFGSIVVSRSLLTLLCVGLEAAKEDRPMAQATAGADPTCRSPPPLPKAGAFATAAPQAVVFSGAWKCYA
jgi:hypothetical protein